MSAALLTVASRPWGVGEAGWIALVPLLLTLHELDSFWKAALAGWIAWLGIGLVVFEGAAPVIPWAYPLLVGLTGLWWAVSAAAFVLASRRLGPTAALATFPLVVVAFEFLGSRRFLFGDLANALGALGYTQFDTGLRVTAGWSGVSGVSLLVLAVNVSVVLLLTRRSAVPSLAVAGACIVIAAIPVPGQGKPDEAVSHQTVAIVQGAFAPVEKDMARVDREAARRLLTRYEDLTLKAVAEGARLVVWGETLLPKAVRGLRPSDLAVKSLDSAPSALVGGRESFGGNWYNTAFKWHEGRFTDVYRKQALVPIVEAGYTHGSARQPPLEIEEVSWGVGVCMDSIFGSLAREAVLAGAQSLVYLTDDTFGVGTVAPDVHLRVTSFRAAETGRWLVFANEAGPSAFIDSRGRLVGTIPAGTSSALSAEVPRLEGVTPFVRFGDWIGAMSVLLGGLSLAAPFTASVKAASRPARGVRT